jgi:hypothetical protein
VPFVVLALLAALPAVAADKGSRVEYAGGTVGVFEPGQAGALYTAHRQNLYFAVKDHAYPIPFDRINLLEYGQNASRRFVSAILVSPILLLSKSRKHFLTVGFEDENGGQQALVFQVHKSDVRVALASLEARTGLNVTYQDEEARKARAK